jgi:hypothetical protein
MDEWRRGVNLSRAAELLAPDAWKEFNQTYIPLMIIGDPESEHRHSRALKARVIFQEAVVAPLRDGSLQLRTLHPQGDPQAQWKPLSPDVFETLEPHELDFHKSSVKLPNGHVLPAKVFLPEPVAKSSAIARAQAAPGEIASADTVSGSSDGSGKTDFSPKLGRPSRTPQIAAAMTDLLQEEKIDFSAPQIRAIQLVRARVMDAAGNNDESGLGVEAIRRVIAPKFRAEKYKKFKASKTLK